MVVPITDVVKMTLSVADISVEPIIGTPLAVASTYCRQLLCGFISLHQFSAVGIGDSVVYVTEPARTNQVGTQNLTIFFKFAVSPSK